MSLSAIAKSFTDGGLLTTAVFSPYLRTKYMQCRKNGIMPIRLLVSEEVDYDHELAVQFNGNVKVYNPSIFIIDESDELCVERKNEWMKKLFVTIEGKMGKQNNLPVIFNGINYFLFEPFNGTVDETAEPLDEGFFVTSEKLTIAIEV